MGQQILDRERDAYYGFFTDRSRNEGKIFYNLDEMWATSNVQDKYKYANSTKLYEYYEPIGEGAFSKVFRAKFLPTGEILAVKVS
jgi:serine/threonine protein kinase